MGGAQLADQGVPGLVVQFLQIGGGDLQVSIEASGHQTGASILIYLEFDFAHGGVYGTCHG
jgi:hypothetical protein